MKEMLLPRDYSESAATDNKAGRKYFETTAGFPNIPARVEPWSALKTQVQRDWNSFFGRSNELTDLEADIELAVSKQIQTVAHKHPVSDITGLSSVVSLPDTAGYYQGQVLKVAADGSWEIGWVTSHP